MSKKQTNTQQSEPKLTAMIRSKRFESFISSVMAALAGILIGFVIMVIASPEKSAAGLGSLLLGGFNTLFRFQGAMAFKGIGDVLYHATPILLTGLSVAFAFKTGLFNIGATGQFTMGLFGSVLTAHLLKGSIQSDILWVLCVLVGVIFGAVWGAIPGFFKSFLGVNEVIVCIMTNYIGMYFVDMMVKNTPAIYDAEKNWTQRLPDNALIPSLGLDKLLGGSSVNIGFFIAVICAVGLYIILEKTTFGFELKACGFNKDSAKYAGINEKRNIVLSLVISGALAGLGGAVYIQGAGMSYTPANSLMGQGFDGIAVALLGTSNPIGTVFASIFFAHLKQGGFYMQSLGFKNEIIDIIVGLTVYFAAFALFFKGLWTKFMKQRNEKKKATEPAEASKPEQKKDEEAK